LLELIIPMIFVVLTTVNKKKGEAIPVTGRRGPRVVRRRGSHIF
jgi:hypothetical protein